MTHIDVVTLGLLLFVACLVAIITRRIGLPYTIGLVVAGIALSVGGYRSGIVLTPELIFTFLRRRLCSRRRCISSGAVSASRRRWCSASPSAARCCPR